MLKELIGDKPIRVTNLRILLVEKEFAKTLRSAEYKVNKWLNNKDLYVVSAEGKNFYVSIHPIEKIIGGKGDE